MPETLLNKDYIIKFLTKGAKWKEGHTGIKSPNDYLGLGLLYYTIAYISKSKVCICLGSGGGFVPRMMKQAQEDLGLKDSRTILIDGNIDGVWGKPEWIKETSFFKTNFKNIEIMIDLTDNAFLKLKNDKIKANYIHIDANHSYNSVKSDFRHYSELLAANGYVTIHDTKNPTIDCGVRKFVDELKNEKEWQVFDFNLFGGVAIVRRDD